MKKIINFKLIMLLTAGLFISCSDEESLGESQIDISTPPLSELDMWIREEYVDPYNMSVVYKFDETEFDTEKYLYPPDKDNMKLALKVVKKVWINSYEDVGGADFVKKVAPRKLVFLGGRDINTDGSNTETLGLAEGGKKITFFKTDYLDVNDEASVKQFIQTIQHEYCHILNQIRPYDKQAWKQITPGDYTSAWYNESPEESEALGFVSPYARTNVDEDIAETLKTMLLLGQQGWNDFIDGLVDDYQRNPSQTEEEYQSALSQRRDAQEKIRAKEDILAEYLNAQYNVNLYDLQDAVQENIQYVIDNY